MPVFGPTGVVIQGLTSVAYPLAMPALPGRASISIKMHDVVGVTRSPFTSSTQSFEWPGEFLQFSCSLIPCYKETARAWIAFLAALRGRSGSFLCGDSSMKFPQGDLAGASPEVNGSNAAGSKVLAIKNLTAGTAKTLRSGDWLQVGSGLTQRLYLNLMDVDADGSGEATLNIYPRLREALTDGTAIVTNVPQGVFRLSSNDRQVDVDNALIHGIKFDAEEYL
ncbi:hypothetical protein Acid345_3159 [Candidatus Koribacter versatilis Ellin345]|uniref:Uncharacterized protein n=1 Tax=Koribacter versatilis (strain Ellin345) TaxID=204669 RepID=Q1ILU0_KORVE|nr:hypothetical protein [Candidatus Koribacter versatilis]ABF42160.1 hypothetical protein Acid345_3159 [Candidatus Koribacter versatilis Ellin345]